LGASKKNDSPVYVEGDRPGVDRLFEVQ